MFIRSVIRRLLLFLPIAYMGFIWYQSSYPSNALFSLGAYDQNIKEYLHLLEFALLYLLLVLALLVQGKFDFRTNLLAAVVSMVYGLVDELHQYFVPSRSATVQDLLKDMIGVIVAWYFFSRALQEGSKFKLWVERVFSEPELFDK